MSNARQQTYSDSRFNVNPRYTPGSPALIDSQTAQRIMRQERAVYDEMIAGVYGETKKVEAMRLGIRGIVEEVWEFRGVLMYRDLLTGETGGKPVCKYCLRRHAVGRVVNDAYEPHPEEIRNHPEMDSNYWAPNGG